MPSVAESLAIAQQHYQRGQLEPASIACRAILAIEPKHVDALRLLGAICHRAGQFDASVTYLSEAVSVQPNSATLHNSLAAVLLASGRLDDAARECRTALQLDPRLATASLTLGNVHHMRGELADAVSHYRHAVQVQPQLVDAQNNLGLALRGLGRIDEAIVCFEQAVRTRPDFAGAYLNLGNVYNDAGRLDEAIAACQEATRLAPTFAMAHANLGGFLQAQGKLADAKTSYKTALRLTNNAALRFTLSTLLPVVYASVQEIDECRQRFAENVAQLVRDGVRLDPIKEKLPAQFFLAYQGHNDRAIQEDIARLCANASQDLTIARGNSSPAESASRDRRIRVGFISSFFKDHTIGHLSRGLIARLSRERFHVTVLSLAAADDAVAREIRASADEAVELPKDLSLARRTIADLNLDVLYYTDIGMDPAAYALANSRMAPVQCVTWGHPSTTGLATIDYFVSSELLETEDAQEHYTERLVALPAMTTYYYRPRLAEDAKTRADFGFAPDEHLYLCPQTLFKFHPEFDAALAAILRRDPQGRLVLIEGRYANWTTLLKQRFAHTMGDVIDRVTFLSSQPKADFLALIAESGVMLDTFHFGGGNTTYEALAVGTPVVTLPSPYLRGRITYACYRQIGVLDCVASSDAEYVDLAVRLATDEPYRNAVRAKILTSCHRLYEDGAAIEAVEHFFEQAVEAASKVRDDANR